MSEISITVPMVPPSVNHYAKHSGGRHYKTAETRGWENAFPLFVRGLYVEGKAFYVRLHITLPEGLRGDVDNFAKLALDGLADCSVFRNKKGVPVSDAHVSHLEVVMDRKTRPECGSTEITVRAIQ